MIDFIDPLTGFGVAVLLWFVFAWQTRRAGKR